MLCIFVFQLNKRIKQRVFIFLFKETRRSLCNKFIPSNNKSEIQMPFYCKRLGEYRDISQINFTTLSKTQIFPLMLFSATVTFRIIPKSLTREQRHRANKHARMRMCVYTYVKNRRSPVSSNLTGQTSRLPLVRFPLPLRNVL